LTAASLLSVSSIVRIKLKPNSSHLIGEAMEYVPSQPKIIIAPWAKSEVRKAFWKHYYQVIGLGGEFTYSISEL
jgi:hypothetical protein